MSMFSQTLFHQIRWWHKIIKKENLTIQLVRNEKDEL